MYYYVSVHHFETAAVTQQQVHCYRGTVEGVGGLGRGGSARLFPREAVVAMAQQCDAEAARGKDHITRTHGI